MDFLNKNHPFKWTAKEEEVFQATKKEVCHAPQLTHLDPRRVLCLQTDATDLGLGAILFQQAKDGRRDIIEYASRKLSPTERNYCTAEKEPLAEFGLWESSEVILKAESFSYTRTILRCSG